MAFLVPARWLGNQRLFSNRVAMMLEEKVPGFKLLNDVTYIAPLGKWALSVIPLIQIFQGIPPVEKLDRTQSASLCFTGTVWTYYSTLIRPQNFGSYILAVCNGAMAAVHGYNLYRRWKYEQTLQLRPASTS